MKKNSLFFLYGILLFLSVPLYAQENSDCLACHGDKTSGAPFLENNVFEKSIHSKNQCISCHTDLKDKEFPHAQPAKVNCGSCHSEQQKQYTESLHGKAVIRGDKLAPRCVDCHGSHNILKVNDRNSSVAPIKIPFVCGKCHQEGAPVQKQRDIHQSKILENYSESIHGEGLLKKGLSVSATCTSCHTSHFILPHTDQRSSIARKNIVKTCTKCHAQIEEVHRKIIKGELWEKEDKVLPACVECHQPHKARRVFYDEGMADKDCLRCHSKQNIKASRDGRSLYVNANDIVSSKHSKISCSKCHSNANPSKYRACETIKTKVECGTCHEEVLKQYQDSTHGRLLAKNDKNVPSCTECHGTHNVLGKENSKSLIFPLNVPNLCGKCHRKGQKAAIRYTGIQHEIIENYTESIHGKGLLKSGLVVTAMCTDCHTAHHELPASDKGSSINKDNIANTCGKCHYGIYEQFIESVHSSKITKTDKELPVCKDCHSAHTIKRTGEEGFKLTIMNICGKCHEEIANTYFETYHGKVSRLGYTKTAKCYDCHGSHDILSVNNPDSHLSRRNVVKTCQKCHPGANRRFAGYLTHATHHDPKKYPYLFWVFWGMTTLLIGTFFFSGVHTFLWLSKSIRNRMKFPKADIYSKEKQVVRFSRLNRTLHISMIVSFISLAFTGMTLKFSYTKWSSVVSHLLGGFETAGYIHRIAAIILFIIFFTHIFDLIRRKRKEFGTWKNLLFGAYTMLPKKNDLFDAIGSVKWFLGLGERPKYGRWTYWEKFDYFAVFWGVAIIGSTGIFLWFSEFLTKIFPGWLINVTTIIHSDEALLATGFIFTVHFFNTHLRPEKFPMDISIFTGRVSVDELKHDRPEEYEKLVANGELEKHLEEPYPVIVIRAIRIFGWTALSLGFIMIIWIIYAMIFAYK